MIASFVGKNIRAVIQPHENHDFFKFCPPLHPENYSQYPFLRHVYT